MATPSDNATEQGEGGQTAFGRYALLEKIGHGGMAEVFRAKSYGVEGFEKILVIKRILATLARDPRFVEMFVREAKLSVRLSHANVVQVFDLGRVSESLFIAMEYVHGLDLSTLLSWARRRAMPVPFSIAAYVAAEVAKGLDHAHRRRDEQLRPLGIVHLDVTPQNVLLSYEGEVKVTDFGIAKARDSLDDGVEAAQAAQGKIPIRGKYAYLSPEQANGRAVDARSDIWSLGVVLYEMLAGSNPFAAPTTFETLRRIRKAEAPPLPLARPDAPADLVAILNKALALDPDKRYPDAARLHDDLLAFLYTAGERFGAHALSETLAELREARDVSSSSGSPDVFAEEGLVRTPVEVPDAADVVTAPPRPSSVALPAADAVAGFARAASLGEHREVTALAVEITGISSLDPLGEAESIRRASAESEALLRHYGADILESEDGRICAVFGAAVPDGRDTDIALRCAMLLSRKLREAAPSSGVGIHSGRVIVEVPETAGESDSATAVLVRDERAAALLSGARDLARAKIGRIAISTAALRHVKAQIDVEPIPQDSRVLASVSGALLKSRKSASELYAKFVGRREELRVLGEIFAAATRRRARLVTLHGAPGIGKTRLLHEVHRRLQRGSYNVGWYLASCAPHGVDVPMSGIAAMLRVLCGIEEGDGEDKIDAARQHLRSVGLGADEVASVIELARAGGDPARGDAVGPQQRAAAALAHVISRLCDDRLHVLAWDDAQAMDPASISVLTAVVKAVAACRVVLLFAGTDDERVSPATSPLASADGKGIQHHLLALTELSRDESLKLIANRLTVREVSAELLAFVLDRAGGLPLHLEELLRAMMESGAIAKVTALNDITQLPVERATLKRQSEGIDLPKSLRGLVASRLAKLSREHRALLTLTALVGEPADIDLLAASASEPVASVERSLLSLEGAGLLRRAGDRSVSFVSPATRDVVLDSAPIEAKRELHAAVAAALGSQPTRAAERIGHHLLESGDRERAASCFAEAAEASLHRGRPDAAVREMSRAFTAADLRVRTTPEVARWLTTFCNALNTARGGRGQGAIDAQAAIDRALIRIDLDGDLKTRCLARVEAGRGLGAASHFDRAKEAFDKAERLAGSDEELLRQVLMARAQVATRSGEFGEAAELLARVEPMLGGMGDEKLYSVLIGLASASAATAGEGARDRALGYLTRAEQVSKRIGHRAEHAVELAKSKGLICFFLRDYPAAAEACAKASELARSAGLISEAAINLHNLGDARIRTREHPAAYAALRQSLALAEEAGLERLAAINRAPIYFLDGLAGDPSAEARLNECISLTQGRGYLWDELSARHWLGLLLLERKEFARARQELQAARKLAVQLSMKSMVTDCDSELERIPAGA